MSIRTSVFLAAAFLAVGGVSPPAARGDDWPQWMGPKRDNVWRETGIIDAFPEGGAKIAWRTPISAGYAGPAVAGGKIYVTDRVLAPGAANPEDPFYTKKKNRSPFFTMNAVSDPFGSPGIGPLPSHSRLPLGNSTAYIVPSSSKPYRMPSWRNG